MSVTDTDGGAIQVDLARVPLLVISPHLDDAVLSAFALLDRDEPVDVLTVFTGAPTPAQRTGWDQFSGFPDSDVAMATRLAENRAAFDGTPHRRHDLGLLDDQYRGRPAAEQETQAVLTWVTDWLDQVGPAAVLAVPAVAGLPVPDPGPTPSGRVRAVVPGWASRGIGRAVARLQRLRGGAEPTDPSLVLPHGHIDHRFVRDTVLRLLPSRPWTPVIFYEEIPYLWGCPADDEVATVSARTGRLAEPFAIPVDRARKAARVACYPTQLAGLFAPLGPLDNAAGLPGSERYWVLASTMQAETVGRD